MAENAKDDDASKQWPREIRITMFLFLVIIIIMVILACFFAISWRRTFPLKPHIHTGASGASGASGSSGSSGGASGSSGTNIIFTTGFTGPQGFTFPTGAAGPRGNTGATGITGTTFTINNAGILDEAVVDAIEQNTSIFWYLVTGDLRASFLDPPGLPVSMTNHLIQWNPFIQQWHDNGPWLGQTGPTGFGMVTGPQGPTGPSYPAADGVTGLDGPTGFSFPGTGPVDRGYLFGPGTDGDFGSADTPYVLNLTRDMFFETLTVGVGSLINTNGFRLFVSRRLTLDGTIACNGANGANAAITTGGITAVGTSQRGGAGGGGYNPNLVALGVGGAGATGVSFGFKVLPAELIQSFLSPSVNRNDAYSTGIAQTLTGLYLGGDARFTLPQGFQTGGSYPAGAIYPGQQTILATISAMLYPVRFPRPFAFPLPINGGGGGGAGVSGNTSITAASGGGGGGIVAIIAATIRGTSNPPTGVIQAKGGNAGANATVRDASGAGGGGGLIVVRTTTPYNQWGLASFDVSGGGPNNQNFGPGAPLNRPEAIGMSGQIFIFQ